MSSVSAICAFEVRLKEQPNTEQTTKQRTNKQLNGEQTTKHRTNKQLNGEQTTKRRTNKQQCLCLVQCRIARKLKPPWLWWSLRQTLGQWPDTFNLLTSSWFHLADKDMKSFSLTFSAGYTDLSCAEATLKSHAVYHTAWTPWSKVQLVFKNWSSFDKEWIERFLPSSKSRMVFYCVFSPFFFFSFFLFSSSPSTSLWGV